MVWLAERLPPPAGTGAEGDAEGRPVPGGAPGAGPPGGPGDSAPHRRGSGAEGRRADDAVDGAGETGDGAGSGAGTGAGAAEGGGPGADASGAGASGGGATGVDVPGPGSSASGADGSGADGRTALHLPHGTPHPGSDADDVLVPAPQALRHELAIQRALRPLKRRVPDPRRRILDEQATAERAARRAGARPLASFARVAPVAPVAPVLVPATDRLLSLALVVDIGPSMSVWLPLVGELRDAMHRTGAFRDVRVWHLVDVPGRVGLRISAKGPAMAPAAVVDPTGRQVVLVLSDCSGPHWWGGRAGPALHLWARRGPTAVLQPLPERLWRRTAAPAVPGRAIASRAGAPNTALRFAPHDGRVRAPGGTLPVPVLELSPDWLGDWAGLVMAVGDRRRDTAVTHVRADTVPHGRPLADESDLPITERVLRFQAAASSTAAELAAHIALSVPALPVMRLIQQRVTPGSRPSDLAEVLLSGLLEPVEPERGLYRFVPGARAALLATLPRPESLAAADLLHRIGREIETRAGSAARTFRAVVPVAAGTGTRGLGAPGEPFALVSEEALEVLLVRATPLRAGGRHEAPGPPGPAVPSVPPASPAIPGASVPPGVAEAAGEEREALWALPPAASVTCPRGLTNRPPRELLVGRVRELAVLEGTFSVASRAEGPATVVVTGVAGVGKTALAAHWAAGVARGGAARPVWWVRAQSQETIAEDLARLTRALLGEDDTPLPDAARASRAAAEWAIGWLAAHRDWVLVLDDAKGLDEEDGGAAGLDAARGTGTAGSCDDAEGQGAAEGLGGTGGGGAAGGLGGGMGLGAAEGHAPAGVPGAAQGPTGTDSPGTSGEPGAAHEPGAAQAPSG
ncbi:SAV_2336 N-terminal domain-related protein, partial [Streptomyces silvensis]|uniref:SAV_2336 N-terminal domain-related protein n=1 Tax=Streptomyces silvensis TaxID=1765722 RepID=UPI00240ECC92